MEFYVIDEYPGPGGRDAYNSLMFFGDTGLPDRSYHKDKERRPTKPLKIEKNLYNMSHLFMQCTNFIVHETLMQRLSSLSGIQFLPVEFTHVICHPYGPDRPVPLEISAKADTDPSGTMRRYQERPNLIKKVGKYFEVASPSHKCISYIGNVMEIIDSRLEALDWIGDSVIRISPETLKYYNCIRYPCGQVVSSNVYKIIKPHIDFRYFIALQVFVDQDHKVEIRKINEA